jgi:hypothetical protein
MFIPMELDRPHLLLKLRIANDGPEEIIGAQQDTVVERIS